LGLKFQRSNGCGTQKGCNEAMESVGKCGKSGKAGEWGPAGDKPQVLTTGR